ncbi:DUF6193 family natural product biosynthesis protein [Streptomyces kaempferi]
MWTLRFSTCTRPGLADLGLFLDAHRGGRYTLSKSLLDGEILGEAAKAEELASVAVRHLPPISDLLHQERVLRDHARVNTVTCQEAHTATVPLR